MKQFLRSFLTLLMLVVWASGFAADKTYSYTFKSGGSFTADKQTKTFGGVNWTITSDGYLSFEGNNKAQQIGSKKTPAKNTVISTSDFPGTIKTIEINGWQGTDANANVEVFVGGVSYGKKDFSTNKTDEHIFNGASSGALKIQIINPASGGSIAAFIKTISVTYEEGPAKTATTLTFPKSVINIEEGNEASFAAQTAILKAGETELNNAITYTTNNDAMFEAYEVNVGPKTLKAGEYGTAVVTATFAGDATYAASTATYTVNYTEKAKPATTLDFGFATKTVNIEEIFTAAATLKSGETAITGAVTYSSSTPEVADVDKTTGEVLAFAAGKTTITATFAGTSEYKSSTASYELTVVDPNLVILDAATDKGTSSSMNQYDAIEKGNINIKGYNIALQGSTYYKIYSKGYFTISAKEGVITKITINCTGANKQDYGPGNFSSDIEGYSFKEKVGTWEGNATSVKFTNNDSKQVKVNSIEITIKNKVITLDENLNNTISEEKGVTVKTVRTLVADKWNTFCVPFDTEIDGTALEGATVKAVGEVVGNVINLVDTTKIEAGVPYLVMPTTGNIENPTFKNVTISVTTPVEKGNDEYKFVGTYSPKKITETEFGTIWGVTAEGKLAKINANTTMKGLRAYFVFPTSTAAAKLNFNGETTGINNIETNATVNGKVYNLNGQYVGNSLNGLKKGIYVVNGKKVIK